VEIDQQNKGAMKINYFIIKVLGCLVLLCAGYICSFATTYYVSSNGSDSNTGTTPNAAFQTIAKINSLTLQAGDQVLFRRGDIFRGQLNIAQSGAQGNPIVIDAFGVGNKPVISGSEIVSDWTNLQGNIWQAYCEQCGSFVTGVFSNSVSLPLGRYPNFDEPDMGYHTILSHSGSTQITSVEPLLTDWTGAEVVIRTMQWILDKSTITSQTENVLDFVATAYEPQDQWGYFIQNHPATLDQEGEWYYDPGAHIISMYSTAGNPGNNTLEVTVHSKGMNLTGSFVTIQNIQIEKTLNVGLYGENTSNLTILNTNIVHSGKDGIRVEGSGSGIYLEDDSIHYVNNNGVVVYGFSDFIFRKSSVKYIGLTPGRGGSGDGQYFGLQYDDDNTDGISAIEKCFFDSLGYVGIDFRCSNVTVKENIVSNYDMVKDDGGGIYTWNGGSPALPFTNQRVISNIVYNAIGSTEGVYNGYPGACGIYMDDCSLNIEVKDNTVFNCAGEGLMLHGTNNVIATGNTIFNNGSQRSGGQFLINTSNCGQTNNITIKNNIFFSKLPFQEVSRMQHQTTDLSNYGNLDSNYYCRPFDEIATIITEFSNYGVDYNLTCWQTSGYDKDANSVVTPIQYSPYSINNTIGSNLFDNGSFDENTDGLYCWDPLADCSVSWDNSDDLDGGALKIVAGNESPTFVVIGVGALEAEQDYVLKFSLIGSDTCRSVGVFLRQSLEPYNNLTATFSRLIEGSRTENEILFKVPVSESDASIVFSFSSEVAPVWMDNISLTSANVAEASPDDSILFFYNDSEVNKTFDLPDGIEYIDVREVFYSGSVTLEPFTSVILLFASQIPVGISTEGSSSAAFFECAPNPADESSVISYSLRESGTVKITICDVLGKAVMSSLNGQQSAGEHRLTLNTAQLPGGVYFIRMEVNRGQLTKRLVVERF
jgi:parallel beta-helix repeat protein